MARIPENELERLKSEISIQRLAEARGIELKAHGKDLIGLCPFHDDHEPSLVISPQKNLWNCLGACGMGGSVIDWVMKAEGVSFRHAVELLRGGGAGLTVGEPIKLSKCTRKRCKLPAPVSFGAEERDLLLQVVDYYHQTLKDSPEALQYLEKRGLKHPELIDYFKLGYANRTLGLRLPEKNRQTGAQVRGKLQNIGIFRETGHERFTGSIVFPIFDEHGHVSEIYGRKVLNNLRAGTAYHTYLPGPHKGVLNYQALTSSPDVILCESIIDALSFWVSGLRNVTTSYGINGFTDDHLQAFKAADIKRVFIAYDRDAAGNKAAETLAEKLMKEGFECFRVLFPKGMDANEYALKVQPPGKALELVIRHAQWMGTGSGQEADASSASVVPETSIPAAKEEKTQEPVIPLAAEKAPSGLTTEIKPSETIITIGDRRWRVRGLDKNMSYDQMKVNLLASYGDAFFVDTFDLYSARSRAAFQKEAAAELRINVDMIRSDLGKVLLKLEELQDKQIQKALEPDEKAVVLTPQEREEALELLNAPNLIERLLADFEACGIVGEETNKLTGYLAAVSRKLATPLAVIIQSSSAAGKTSLMEAVLAFIPEEDRVKYSAMTGQSLFYMGEINLKHKILAIVEEEGAERAAYALKLLQSEGELTIASTGKDPQTGRLVTHEYRVEGPVMIFVTTTSIDIEEELKNRCIVLTVDESREQTRAIHKLQRERRTLEGLWARQERNKILQKHRNAQRLLKPVYVINIYARRLTFLDDQTRTRRDHDRYLDLIESITILHQFQRPFQTDRKNGRELRYLEVTLEDIELANRLMHEVLGRTLDELPPQTRRFLSLLENMVRGACEQLNIGQEDYRFYRRDILTFTGWSYNQLRIHIERLLELEYVLVHRGHQGQRICYELLYNGQGKQGEQFCMGLLDVAAIRNEKSNTMTSTLWGKKPDFVPPLCPRCAPVVGGVLGSATEEPQPVSVEISEESLKTALKGVPRKSGSYHRHSSFPLAAKEGTMHVPPGNGSKATVEGGD